MERVGRLQNFMREWGDVLYGRDKKQMIEFLQGLGLISKAVHCHCGKDMSLEKKECLDGYRW